MSPECASCPNAHPARMCITRTYILPECPSRECTSCPNVLKPTFHRYGIMHLSFVQLCTLPGNVLADTFVYVSPASLDVGALRDPPLAVSRFSSRSPLSLYSRVRALSHHTAAAPTLPSCRPSNSGGVRCIHQLDFETVQHRKQSRRRNAHGCAGEAGSSLGL